jgi:hypothetical protein
VIWVGYLLQRSGPWTTFDTGAVWGLALVSLLVLSAGLNRIEVRAGASGIARRISPLPWIEGGSRYAKREIAALHFWQHAAPARPLREGGPRPPMFTAGILRTGGKLAPEVVGLSSEADAAKAAELIAEQLGMTAARLDSAREPTGWRGIGLLLFILISPIVAGRIADFVLALLRD